MLSDNLKREVLIFMGAMTQKRADWTPAMIRAEQRILRALTRNRVILTPNNKVLIRHENKNPVYGKLSIQVLDVM